MNQTILKKYRNNLKILGTSIVTRRKFHIEDPQILGATGQNLVGTAAWRSELVQPDHLEGNMIYYTLKCGVHQSLL